MLKIIRKKVIISGFGVGVVAAWLTGVGFTARAAAQQAVLPAHPAVATTPLALLTQSISDTVPNAAQVRRGLANVIAGDCLSCHLRPGGEPFAGGLGLNTPFGVIYSRNITSDSKTGIGAWTNDQFYRAMHEGIGAHGENLYPAFPYPAFRRISREDDDAILAYLKTTPPVSYTPPANRLPFPLNIRLLVKGWNLLFLGDKSIQAGASQTAEWNQGAYLVTGPGHCGACHTPKNFLGADKRSEALTGSALDNWTAPNLTETQRTGLGAWSLEDVEEFLKTGRNTRAGAGGSMAEVVTYSTSLMDDAERHAIAIYLKSLPKGTDRTSPPPDAAAMKRGAEIYADACASCHLVDGIGQPETFPPLAHDTMVQQPDPAGVLHIILAGGRIGGSPTRPSRLAMPSFAWKLTDTQVADATTFIRNSWGNQAAPVSAEEVANMRKQLDLESLRLTANSGDHQ